MSIASNLLARNLPTTELRTVAANMAVDIELNHTSEIYFFEDESYMEIRATKPHHVHSCSYN